MSREQMIGKARAVLCDPDHLGGHILTKHGRTVNLAEVMVDALLPQVSTVEEVVALQPGTGFVDQVGNLVQWRGHSITYLVNGVRVDHPAWWEQDCEHPRLAWPLTVVWQP